LTDLYQSEAMKGQNWILSKTWSSTAGDTAATRKVVDLKEEGKVTSEAETESAYVACVK
jgi:hypothetical protein